MYTEAEIKELCAEMLEDLKVQEGDAEMSPDGVTALIPYYSHGRNKAHVIDLEMMAKTALIFARSRQPQ